MSVHDLVKHLRNNNSVVIVEGADGMGKSVVLEEIEGQLRKVEKMNVMMMRYLSREAFRLKD